MKHSMCALLVIAAVTSALPAWGAPQAHRLREPNPRPGQAVGLGLAAAAVNTVYFPLRLGLTVVTAGVGGLTGWLTGGNKPAAHSVWDVTDGQAYVTPGMLNGEERWRFGP